MIDGVERDFINGLKGFGTIHKIGGSPLLEYNHDCRGVLQHLFTGNSYGTDTPLSSVSSALTGIEINLMVDTCKNILKFPINDNIRFLLTLSTINDPATTLKFDKAKRLNIPYA